jgi:hypothetical protein
VTKGTAVVLIHPQKLTTTTTGGTPVARRTTTTDTTTATAIDRLVRSRADGLYELGAKLQDLGAAHAAVAAAVERESAVLAEAVALQERLVAEGWRRTELQEAGLWVEPAAGSRRRRGRPATGPATVGTPAGSGASDTMPSTQPDAATGVDFPADSATDPRADRPVPVG